MFLLYLLTIFGLSGIFLYVLLDLLVFHQERGEKLAEWLSKLVTWTGKRAEKTATAMNIQGKINSFIATVNIEVEELLPYNLKIKWVSPEISEQAFIEKNRVVILLSYHQNQDENLSRGTILYMNKAVIPEARPHIHFKLCKAIDLMMTKKALFSFIEARSSFGHFIETILKPETQKDSELKEFCTVIDEIDERGLFTRVLLRELLEIGRRRAGITETGDTVFETGKFTKFLDEIAKKESGEDVPLSFMGNFIRVAIFLIARSKTRELARELGPEMFLHRIREKIKQGVNVIYVFARTARNIDLAKEVCNECIQYASLTKVHEAEFPTRTSNGLIVTGYCVIFYNRQILSEPWPTKKLGEVKQKFEKLIDK